MSTLPLFNHVIVFADGACSGNPGPGGWGTVCVTPQGHVKEFGGGDKQTTNNRMEMTAVAVALEYLANCADPIGVYTDSTYVIRGVTQWSWGWRKRGWKTAAGEEVANRDLWERLLRAVASLRSEAKLSWHYVRGHRGIPGNERVDEIAVHFSQQKYIQLYDGPLQRYHVAIHDIPDDTSLPPMQESKAKVVAYSYLSCVDGIVRRHQTWPECERLVKGRSGAKFKKAKSVDEEEAILADWGYSLANIEK